MSPTQLCLPDLMETRCTVSWCSRRHLSLSRAAGCFWSWGTVLSMRCKRCSARMCGRRRRRSLILPVFLGCWPPVENRFDERQPFCSHCIPCGHGCVLRVGGRAVPAGTERQTGGSRREEHGP